MDIKRKLEIVEQAVRSISEHSDEEADLLRAALNKCIQIVEDEKDAIDARVQARIVKQLVTE